MKISTITTAVCAVIITAACQASSPEWREESPAKNWQESSLTGSGVVGAMVEGRVEDETIHLSHCKLYLPNPGTSPKDYKERDGFMTACDLKISMRFGRPATYSRRTDFATGECIVEATDGKGRLFRRSVCALRGMNVIALKTEDKAKRDVAYCLSPLLPSGWRDIAAAAAGVKEIVSRPDYYRCEFASSNPWNPLTGYEVFMKRSGIEAFVAVVPSNEAKPDLDALAAKGYDALVAENAAAMRELMARVSFELEGPADAAEIVRRFNSARYNIISSTGGDHIPNLQGLWAGTWSAPWFASFTVNGNLPCAISFFDKGRTTEFNECLLKWLEARLPEMRSEARRRYNARGFRVAAQTTISGIETDTNPNYPHERWHGGAAWLLSRLYDGYRHTLDKDWLARIYPLMKEIAQYYEDVLVEMEDGTLGFNPSYSPENCPTGKKPTSVNATMDNAIAKQFLDEVVAAAKTLGVDAEESAKWAAMRSRLTPYAVSDEGFFAEWLAPGQPDNNEHRHASHLYALYDNAPAEIVTNEAFVAAIKKTIDARMDFNENRSRTMAFGYVQNGLAACKIGDAERAERCLKLLNAKNWLAGGGSCHDWKNCFNTDISGGYPYLISEMLVHSEDDYVRFLPAKPASWKKGRIAGLLLRGNIVLEHLSWRGDEWVAALKFPSGRVKLLAGKAGDKFCTATLAQELAAATPDVTRHAGVYQWSIEIPELTAKETKAPPRSYLTVAGE